LKKILFLITVLTISVHAVSFSWLESKIKSGGTLPSKMYEVDSAGWDFRQYTWIDPAGRVCTVIFTDKKGGNPDCDFPPKDFDYKKFTK
jgi:hypothetical protein